MVFLLCLYWLAVLERELRERMNFTNLHGFIRPMRKFATHLHLRQVQVFALSDLRF